MLTVVCDSAGRDNTTDPATLTSSLIDDIVREGARRMLAEALQAEVDADPYRDVFGLLLGPDLLLVRSVPVMGPAKTRPSPSERIPPNCAALQPDSLKRSEAMSFREDRLNERVAEVRPKLAKAREVAELADSENRPMTEADQKVYDEGVSQARSVADAVKAHRHDAEVFAVVRELSDNVTGGLSHDDSSSSGAPSKSRRLSFKGMGAHVAARMMPDGTKALAPFSATAVRLRGSSRSGGAVFV